MARNPIQNPETHLVSVYAVTDPVKAELIRNMLIENGVNCELGGEQQAGFTGTLAVEIIVCESDAARARALIQEHNF